MVQSEMFELVTLMFLDIPSFADFVTSHSPTDVTDCLVNLDGLIQAALSQVDECRVEMISDSCMVRHYNPAISDCDSAHVGFL